MTERIARCSCGGLRLRCAGEPVLVSLCHCAECQRRTGSSFGIAAFYEAGRVAVEGETRGYARASESGFDVAFSFCPVCGTSVFWRPMRKPGMIAVAVGCFADPGFPPPTQSVHEAGRVPWLGLDLD